MAQNVHDWSAGPLSEPESPSRSPQSLRIEAVPTDPVQMAMVARVNLELDRWKGRKFWGSTMLRFGVSGPDSPAGLARPFRPGFGAYPPVLYAGAWSLGKGRPDPSDLYVEVYADGYALRSRMSEAWTPAGGPLEVADVGGIPIEPELILVASDGPDRGKVAHRLSAARYPNAIETVRALHLLAASGLWNAPRVLGVEVEPYVRPGPAPDAGPRGPRPAHRLVRDAREAEEMAAEWTRWMGWPDATVTPVGADAGIDVVSREVAAQVKFEAVKTGRPVLQALYGSAIAQGVANHVFFSSAGYTAEAVAWADRVRMALFLFSIDGGIDPMNSRAHELVNAS